MTDFFEQQALARRNTRKLLGGYVLAVAFVVASFCAATGLAWALLGMYGALPLAGEEPLRWSGLFGTYGRALLRVPYPVYATTAAAVVASVLVASAWRMRQLAEGGAAVAHLIGARYLEPWNCTPVERRALNVVEEMAIASGIAVPPVYVIEHDDAINALVAGYSPNEAVIIATRAALARLSRDELQGVMGHEFSHILNGDMRINLWLVGILAGLSWIGELGEEMVHGAARSARKLSREERGGEGFVALFGALLAFIGFPGTLAADAIRAAISREREFLADAASVQFTRNPDGIAGALDSILVLRAGTTVRALHATELAHMFFAPAVSRWWTFPTHPPVAERIRRAHPRFLRDEYRRVRHGLRTEVAVLDGAGNVLKPQERATPPAERESRRAGWADVIMIMPSAQHVDHAANLLGRLPPGLREAVREAQGAEAAMFALSLEADIEPRRRELDALQSRRGAQWVARVERLYEQVREIARQHMLTLADLAVPAIKAQPQPARDAFLADQGAVVEADQRVTLREFVLHTFLQQRLRAGAGQPIPTRYQRIEEVADDAHLALSIVAHAARQGVQAAFDKGAAILGLGWRAPVPRERISVGRVRDSLERLRVLRPFAKPALIKACFETAAADGEFRLSEAELVRMIAATLDCPVPPVLAAHDPLRLAA